MHAPREPVRLKARRTLSSENESGTCARGVSGAAASFARAASPSCGGGRARFERGEKHDRRGGSSLGYLTAGLLSRSLRREAATHPVLRVCPPRAGRVEFCHRFRSHRNPHRSAHAPRDLSRKQHVPEQIILPSAPPLQHGCAPADQRPSGIESTVCQRSGYAVDGHLSVDDRNRPACGSHRLDAATTVESHAHRLKRHHRCCLHGPGDNPTTRCVGAALVPARPPRHVRDGAGGVGGGRRGAGVGGGGYRAGRRV
eukprot:ctg_1010.g334